MLIKHKLVYSKSFKRMYISFCVYVMIDLIILTIVLAFILRSLFEIKDELLRYDNLNFTEEEINKIKNLNEEEFNMFIINSTKSMENEDDIKYITYYFEKQYVFIVLKSLIYTLGFCLISRIVVLIMLVSI